MAGGEGATIGTRSDLTPASPDARQLVAVASINALPTTPPVRLIRAATFGALTAGLADGAHRMVGHETPPAVTVLGWLGVAWLVWPMTTRALSARRLVVTTVTLQWVMHAAFVLAAALPTGPMHGMQLREGAGALVDLLPGGNDPVMFAGHMGAAVLLAWWMAAGERLAFRAIEVGVHAALGLALRAVAQVRRVTALLAAAAATGDARERSSSRRWVERAGGRCRLRLVEHAVIRRGPPGATARNHPPLTAEMSPTPA